MDSLHMLLRDDVKFVCPPTSGRNAKFGYTKLGVIGRCGLKSLKIQIKKLKMGVSLWKKARSINS